MIKVNEMNSTAGTAAAGQRTNSTFEVRPGVKFPDWRVVTSQPAKQALTDIVEAFGIEKSFAEYDAGQDRVRVLVLRFMAAEGRAPAVDELTELAALPAAKILEHLRILKKKDLVVFDEASNRIIGAYPITERQTEHLVVIGQRQIHAMCAIDALGTGSMFGQDIKIKSSCRATGQPISIELGAGGTEIKSADPETALVWSGIQFSDGCAADSLCTVLAFFSSDRAFDSWRASEHPDTPGYRLTLSQGIEVGRAIFDPFLAEADG
ncbi:MAG: hypothetical protein CMM10_17265 [Rhodospirillaceae bacterium]|nr:hypothetical protein [Rhodospirillaceae bacterium]